MKNEQKIKFYSVAEVSKILEISRSRVYEWVISPQCPFLLVLRIGRRIIITANITQILPSAWSTWNVWTVWK